MVTKPKALRIKPFTCPLCLSFWITIFYQLYIKDISLMPFLIAFFTSIIDILHDKIYGILKWVKK